MTWNYVDILLLLLVLLSALHGWRRGFLLGLLDILTWIGSIVLALRFYQPVARRLGPYIGWPDVWDLPLAFLLTALAAGLVINLLGYALIKLLPTDVHQGVGNRLLGIVPGLVHGLISAIFAAALLLSLPLPTGLRLAAQESVATNRLATVAQRAETALRPVFGSAVAHTLNTLTVQPNSDQLVELPYAVADAPAAPELEVQMLDLVNRERVSRGLAPLTADAELREVARRHSADMFARGYFSHVTPEGLDPFDRIRDAGIAYSAAGENLALAPTLSLAHSGLMNSPGHRANILRPEFGRVGIGIVDGGIRGLMVTQNFRD